MKYTSNGVTIGFNAEIARLMTFEEFKDENKHLGLSEDQLKEAHGLMLNPKNAEGKSDADAKAAEEKQLKEQQAAEAKLKAREEKRLALQKEEASKAKAQPAEQAKADAKKGS